MIKWEVEWKNDKSVNFEQALETLYHFISINECHLDTIINVDELCESFVVSSTPESFLILKLTHPTIIGRVYD